MDESLRYDPAARLDELRPHPRNYRGHPEDQVEHIVQSIRLHGVYRNVVVAADGTILAGHGVVLAARRLGRETIPVYRVDVAPDDPRAIQIMTGDNEISRLGEIDDRALTELLRELTVDGGVEELLGTGFNAEQLAALAYVTRTTAELADFDAVGEWLGLPGFETAPPEPQITVKFVSVEDRDRFVADVLHDQRFTKKVHEAWTCWWPERGRDDLQSVRFEVVAADA